MPDEQSRDEDDIWIDKQPLIFPGRDKIPQPSNMTLGDETLIDAEIDSIPQPLPLYPRGFLGRCVFGGTLVMIAFNLRPLFSSLSAVLPSVVTATGMTPGDASLMTSLPVVCLGIFAPIAPRLARRFGAEAAILLLMVLLALGTSLRGFASIPLLAIGTALAGVAIANVNVLLPGLIKRDFAHRTGLMSGLYTMALCGGAALAAGATVPLQRWVNGSWSLALGLWAVPAIVTALLWAPQIPRQRKHAGAGAPRINGLWRCPLAWQVTAFMVLQSMLSFSVFGWLAPMLHARGLNIGDAGLIVSVSVLCQTFACLIAPALAAKSRSQRLINVAVTLMSVIGLVGCLFAPISTIWFWAILQGVGQGALTSVALTLIVLRSSDAHVAAELSAMVQGVGYGVGAAGPLLVGILHDLTGGFDAVGILFVLVGFLACLAGVGAGRPRHVCAQRHGQWGQAQESA